MPSTPSLLERISEDFADLTFENGQHFEWQPDSRTVVYDIDDPYFDAHLLHEVSHAILNHTKYDRDIDLIAMERDAWQLAKVEMAERYGVRVPASILHYDMDTYRDWLHSRSTCPHCGSNGLQVKKREYRCVTCLRSWKVNEARSCALRRYRIT